MRAPNEAEEGIVLLVAVGVLLYVVYAAIQKIPNPFSDLGNITDGLANAFNGGILTQNQVNQAAGQEAAGIVKAGAGSISATDAAAQAAKDQAALHKDQVDSAVSDGGVEPWTIIL